jgi:hypothetical protein
MSEEFRILPILRWNIFETLAIISPLDSLNKTLKIFINIHYPKPVLHLTL